MLCYTAVLYHQVPPPIDALSCYPVQNMHLHAIALLKGLLEVNTSFFFISSNFKNFQKVKYSTTEGKIYFLFEYALFYVLCILMLMIF